MTKSIETLDMGANFTRGSMTCVSLKSHRESKSIAGGSLGTALKKKGRHQTDREEDWSRSERVCTNKDDRAEAAFRPANTNKWVNGIQPSVFGENFGQCPPGEKNNCGNYEIHCPESNGLNGLCSESRLEAEEDRMNRSKLGVSRRQKLLGRQFFDCTGKDISLREPILWFGDDHVDGPQQWSRMEDWLRQSLFGFDYLKAFRQSLGERRLGVEMVMKRMNQLQARCMQRTKTARGSASVFVRLYWQRYLTARANPLVKKQTAPSDAESRVERQTPRVSLKTTRDLLWTQPVVPRIRP
ncbi:hypothetical protein FB45DRAFT_1140593 [Roridomyces roridus]|uniref:Uncharacterized protein n=1 Tax=Roridomyces roridus TaxID=1738132 RepID=A0AAD7AZT5_9AGAR|nr:hypothetical protein FB45DRAFT_1140593 [Roridomyces roridus]